MEKIKSLDRYKKIVIIISVLMVILFTVLYPITINRVGFLYQDKILVPSIENKETIYSGEIKGTEVQIIVSEEKAVEFHYGDEIYGPYIVKEDSTAIPEGEEHADKMTGVEILEGEEIFFRGGILDLGDIRFLYDESGEIENLGIFVTMSDGTVVDAEGNIVDPMQPSVETILDLTSSPELTHKGEWAMWGLGVFLCMFTVFSILYADEMFRFSLRWKVSNVESVEPSTWTMIGRYINWTLMPIMALAVFIIGLQ